MAKCSYCRQRKAKRHCPALGSDICPLCCGLLREKTLHCPKDCRYLVQHKPYQEKKVIQKRQTYSPDIAQDERLNWLTLHIEAPLKESADKKSSFSDREAVLALEYAREKTEKEKTVLLLSQPNNPVQNEIGEAIFQSLEQCRYERQIILPRPMAGYSKEEKLKCLENVILAVKFMAKGDLDGRNYIQDLIERFSRLKEVSGQKRIVSPT
jgi:hypothetical protein